MGNEQGKKKRKGKKTYGDKDLVKFEDWMKKQRTKSTLGKFYTTVENSALSPNDFELMKVVGQGSYGKVCQVRYKKNQQIYAMKIIKKETVFKENQAEHTAAERRILEQIDHPFIVSLRFAFQTPDKLYLVLDYFNGGELYFHLKENSGFEEASAKFYAAEVLLALEHLHSLNIIYRDLKPENVLLDEEGHIKLTDFGLAKEGIDLPNGTKTFCGTPEYLAPEVLQGLAYGKPVDV